MLTIGSLFAGIGGLELGLEDAGLGPVLWQAEINPFCRAVLAQHWPHAKRYEDVREIHSPAHVDIICGGFPCQDLSSARRESSRPGLCGPRSGLWREFRRVVENCLPPWVVVENVESGAGIWIDPVRHDLEQLGYESLPLPIAAADVGAPHLRPRVFIVARHTDRDSQPVVSQYAKVEGMLGASTSLPGWSEPPSLRVADGISPGMAALGNAVVPQAARVVGELIKELSRGS